MAQNKITYSRVMQDSMLAGIDEKAHRVSPDRVDSLDQSIVRMGNGPYTILARLLVPAVSRAAVKSSKAQTFANFALLACALERHRLASGELPQTLDMLVPRFLPVLPREVATGEPLRYERNGPDRFTLLSAGWSGATGDELIETRRARAQRDDTGEWIWQSGRE
jgi:hypothetical protein